jgi:tyrosinase
MSQQLQLEYLDAVLCMMDLPSITPFSGPETRFDDFQALHIALTYGINWVVCYNLKYLPIHPDN